MTIRSELFESGVRTITMDFPPVNALPSSAWFELGEAMDEAGNDSATHVVVMRAEGRGFNAGVDIKEMQRTSGFEALIAANRGCYASFKAIYECKVPVVAAVNGFCLGGGVGLVGNSDVIIAADDAYFGVPEVDRGALGAGTHLARLVPTHELRAMYYTSQNVTAQRLHELGSVHQVVPAAELTERAILFAEQIAAKDTAVIRAAKEALNGIDPVDVNRSYRFEQGFTFELNLSGVADKHRDEFVDGASGA